MSDQLTAVAELLGVPEEIIQRSAEARAVASGGSGDEILNAWAGGAPAPVAATPAIAETAVEPEPTTAQEMTVEPDVGIIEPAAAPSTPASVAPGPYRPPILVDARDNPMTVLVGALGLFLIVLMVGLVGPSLQLDIAGARSSEIPLTAETAHGQDIYMSLGCSSCHTQMVRPVIADVGLGDVTLNDSNQVFGTRRFGPDLSDVGSRMTVAEISAVINGSASEHPAYGLSPEDLGALASYVSQTSSTASGS